VTEEEARSGAPAPEGYDELNPYARIIVDEALRRGIGVEVLDPELGEMVLSRDGRSITTVESLSELTTAVAFRRCDNKVHTRRVLAAAGLNLPAGRLATGDDEDVAFLERWKELVVKPARGEGGQGVTVGVVDREGLGAAVRAARAVCPDVLLEQRCQGEDLRIVVIGGQVVAASVRRSPVVTGTGADTAAELIESLSDERGDATDGTADIPLDATTEEVLRDHRYGLDDVLPEGEVVPVRRTANVHTGGTITDVTDALHPDLAATAVAVAKAIDIPVVGVDLMVTAVDQPDYVVIEANEQPGLANHDPRPTAQRFVDLLFPESATSDGGARSS
jgi:GNAT-family acetyltransferase (TIGR03103 family)